MTRGESAKLVAIVLATWPTQAQRLDASVVAVMVDAWHTALEDLTSAIAARALKRLAATSKFIPSCAEIREAADVITRGERRPGGDAWGDVRKAIGRQGRNRPPGVAWDFEDSIVRAAVDALGWTALCDSENAVADRARFVELYDRLAASDQVDAVTRTLPGAAAPARIGGTKAIRELVAAAPAKMLAEGKKKP
jgi:hypothetical protein